MAGTLHNNYIPNEDKTIHLALSKVLKRALWLDLILNVFLLMQIFKITYCDYFHPSKGTEWKAMCSAFVDAIGQHRPDMRKCTSC